MEVRMEVMEAMVLKCRHSVGKEKPGTAKDT